jgi:hypothetical protein
MPNTATRDTLIKVALILMSLPLTWLAIFLLVRLLRILGLSILAFWISPLAFTGWILAAVLAWGIYHGLWQLVARHTSPVQ